MNGKRALALLVTMGILLLGVRQVTGKQNGSQNLQGPYGSAFTYQGQLKDAGGLVNGACDLRFILWDAEIGGSQVGNTLTLEGVEIEDGLFTVRLDFGVGVFSGDARWVEVAVDCGGGFATLSPRQALTPAPYAVHASSGPFWSLSGDAGTTPGPDYLGTSDNTALVVKVNNTRALRIEPSSEAPNLIGGWWENYVTGGVRGATIGGGGGGEFGENRVTDDFGTVGGGVFNQAGDGAGTTSDRTNATVGGGYENMASGAASTVAGGLDNIASGEHSFVGGGWGSQADGQGATVAGGGGNVARGYGAAVGGGGGNQATGLGAVVAGGIGMCVGTDYNNVASGDSSTIAGGACNIADNASTTIAGGLYNSASGEGATVGGGAHNTASGAAAVVAGGGGYHDFFGNLENVASGNWSTIGGGGANLAGDGADPETAEWATVGGGFANFAIAQLATIGGGNNNHATDEKATVGGGYGNFAGDNAGTPFDRPYATVGGGFSNHATGGYSTISGGYENQAGSDLGSEEDRPYAAVGGGRDNVASGTSSVVAGGDTNTASGWRSTVPGGVGNTAAGEHSFAAGRRAKALHNGAFVWADSTEADFSSDAANEFLVRAYNGVKIVRGASTFSPSQAGLQVDQAAAAEAGWFYTAHASNPFAVLKVAKDPAAPGNFIDGVERTSGGAETRKFHITKNGTYEAGSDFAESLPVAGDPAGYEPGDVLVISLDRPGAVEKCNQPYDGLVVGVYSTRPGFLGADKEGATEVAEDEVPVAVLGIVPVKVTDENGPVQPGDLLTTSSTAGHAMRCAGMELCFGRTLGKALEGLDSGQSTGVIQMLVSLQ